MSSRPTKGLIALNADGDCVDDARRRLLADWLKLVGHRLHGGTRASEAARSVGLPDGGLPDGGKSAVIPVGAATRPAVRGRFDDTAAPAVPVAQVVPVDSPLPPAVGELGLPPRMSQVLVGLLAGAAEKQIARTLSLSPHTVHAYVKQIYKRLSVSSRGELLARFVTLNR